MDNPEKLET